MSLLNGIGVFVVAAGFAEDVVFQPRVWCCAIALLYVLVALAFAVVLLIYVVVVDGVVLLCGCAAMCCCMAVDI